MSNHPSRKPLKVHKIEIFLASILKFVLFLYKLGQNIKILPKKFFDQAIIRGDTIFPLSLRLRGIKFDIFTPNQHIKSSLEHLID